MKKATFQNVLIFLGILLSVGLFLVLPIVHAEDSGPNTERMLETNSRIEKRGEGHRAVLTVNAQDRIINLSSNIMIRLTAAVARLMNVTNRLETRIEKLETRGVDTQSASEKLREATGLLLATQDIIDTRQSLNTAVRGETPRESFAHIRVQFASIHDLIKRAHTLLTETIALLKVAPQQTGRGLELKSTTATSVPAHSDTE